MVTTCRQAAAEPAQVAALHGVSSSADALWLKHAVEAEQAAPEEEDESEMHAAEEDGEHEQAAAEADDEDEARKVRSSCAPASAC